MLRDDWTTVGEGDIAFQFLLGCYRRRLAEILELRKHFQFLLGCYAGYEDWVPPHRQLSIPFRMLLVEKIYIIVSRRRRFQFLLGCYKSPIHARRNPSPPLFQFLLGCYRAPLCNEERQGYILSIPFRMLQRQRSPG